MPQTPGVTGPPDAALAGAPQARKLVREVMADHGRVRRLDVVGAGGYGKTVLLEAIAGIHRDAGATVRRDVPASSTPIEDGAVFVIDDAHLLTAPELESLTEICTNPAVTLIVAHRPWPRSPVLAALGGLLAAHRPPVVLEALEPAGVAARAARLLPDRPRRDLVEHVFAHTSGVPALVDRLLVALVSQAPPSDPTAVPLPARPPAGVLAQLGYTLQAVDDGVRELLLARAVGAPLDADVLGALLAPDPDRPLRAAAVDQLIEAAQSSGLLAAGGAAVPLVSAALLAGTSAARILEMRREFADVELRRGGDVVTAARGLLGTGAGGTRMAALFTAAGDAAVRAGSSAADELYAAAVTAGAPPLELAARRAESAMLAGRLDEALAQADQVLAAAGQTNADDLTRAGRVAAAALARRGLLARSAGLYRWLGTVATGSDGVLAVPVLIGTGALVEAREAMLNPAVAVPGAPPRPPTLASGAEELLAQGVLDSVTGSPTTALSQLTRSAALLTSTHRAALLPDTPHALGALVAVQCGELDVARSVLNAAVSADLGGPCTAARHLLLQAWIATHRGASNQANALLVQAGECGPLEPRDELLAAALEVALARRASDLATLLAVWGRAREAVVRHPVDLFTLPPLGELLVGAARLREQAWLRPHLDQAWAILVRLGSPPLWTAPLHWACLQAAIAAGAGDTAGTHAAELGEIAESSRYASALATAARSWIEILGGNVDAVAVDAAARGLHAVGLTWEGGRLAGQAAIRTHDRKDMTALLGCARALQGGSGAAPAPTTASAQPLISPDPGSGLDRSRRVPPASNGRSAPTGLPAHRSEQAALDDAPGVLSDRELEVAELVLAGMTYKQVGEQLFISAKTVEHHVARMRQRLGSTSRGELFAQLRQVVGKPSP